MDLVPDRIYINVFEARRKDEKVEPFQAAFKSSIERNSLSSASIKTYFNILEEPRINRVGTFEDVPSSSSSMKFVAKAQTPSLKNENPEKINASLVLGTYNSMPSIRFLSTSNKQKIKEVKFTGNNSEKLEINNQNIKLSHQRNNFFIQVKNDSRFVFLCKSQFTIIAESLFVIGKYFVRSFNKEGQIILTKPEVYEGLKETSNQVRPWIIREKEDAEENKSGLKRKKYWEIVSCSNYPIKKLISTPKFDKNEYCHPLKIEPDMKFSIGDEIFTVQLESHNKPNR